MKHIAAAALTDLITAQRSGLPAMLLDVREAWEVEIGRIEVAGADHLGLPMGSIAQRFGELDPAQPIVCICHHGVRSAQVAAFLERQGFESVYNLTGGTDAWSTQVDARLTRY